MLLILAEFNNYLTQEHPVAVLRQSFCECVETLLTGQYRTASFWGDDVGIVGGICSNCPDSSWSLKIVHIPHFSESNHPMVKSLFHLSDRQLLTLFQRYPEQGKYFTAIFCRYSPIVYTLIRHSARSPVQADYLFAMTWRHIFYELRGLDLRQEQATESNSFQNWLINMTAICINQADLPPVESIHYDLKAAPPPLWCYLEAALEQLPPGVRLMTIMAQTFHWSETRIAAYLQAEGEMISPAQVKTQLEQGYQLLEAGLPDDIRVLYLGEEATPLASESQQEPVSLMKIGMGK